MPIYLNTSVIGGVFAKVFSMDTKGVFCTMTAPTPKSFEKSKIKE